MTGTQLKLLPDTLSGTGHSGESSTLLYRTFLPSIGNIIFASLLVVLCVSVANGLLGDGDTAYHIRTGELILDTFKIPTYDPYSLHEPPLAWTAHEWLAELIMATMMRMFGLAGVVFLFALVLTVSHWMLFQSLRSRSGDLFLSIVVALIATASSSIHWLARPHAFSLLFIVVWSHLLDQFQQGGKNRLVWFPVLMVFWVNLHGGFIMGLILIAVYFGANLWHALARAGLANDYWRKAKILFLLLLGSTAACVVNPFGLEILWFPVRVASDRFIADHVIEFLSPNFHGALPFKYMLLALVGALALCRVPLSLIEATLVILLCYMSLYSARHISLFAIVVAPILLRTLQHLVIELPDCVQQWYRKRKDNLTVIDQRVNGCFWPIAVLCCLLSLVGAGVVNYQFSDKKFPVHAVSFLTSHPISGNMFNSDEFGDYLIYSAWPTYRVFMDGRSDMYGEKYGREYLQVAHALPGWRGVLEKYDISLVFFETNSPLTTLLQEQKDWQAIYSDSVATIFVKRDPANLSWIQNTHPSRLPIEASKKN